MKTPHFEITDGFIEFFSPFGETEVIRCNLTLSREDVRRMARSHILDFAHEWWPEHKDEYPTYEDFLYACWFRCGYNYAVSMKE